MLMMRPIHCTRCALTKAKSATVREQSITAFPIHWLGLLWKATHLTEQLSATLGQFLQTQCQVLAPDNRGLVTATDKLPQRSQRPPLPKRQRKKLRPPRSTPLHRLRTKLRPRLRILSPLSRRVMVPRPQQQQPTPATMTPLA